MISGKKMNITKTPVVKYSQGITDLTTASNDMPVTFWAAYRHTPTGGVIRPNDKVITRKTTKNSGDTPILTITGNRIGTKMKIAAVASMNIPTNSKKTKSANKITS